MPERETQPIIIYIQKSLKDWIIWRICCTKYDFVNNQKEDNLKLPGKIKGYTQKKVFILSQVKSGMILSSQRNVRVKNLFELNVFRVTGVLALYLSRRKGKFQYTT